MPHSFSKKEKKKKKKRNKISKYHASISKLGAFGHASSILKKKKNHLFLKSQGFQNHASICRLRAFKSRGFYHDGEKLCQKKPHWVNFKSLLPKDPLIKDEEVTSTRNINPTDLFQSTYL